MKPLDYMSFKNGILQDWVKEAEYDYDIEKLEMVQQVWSLTPILCTLTISCLKLINLSLAISEVLFSKTMSNVASLVSRRFLISKTI